jgi:hypothetical protein
MSHITKVETKIKDMLLLQKTLDTLGYQFKCAEAGTKLQVQAWENDQIDADLEIMIDGHFGIAVNETENGLEFSADWWGVEMYTEKKQEEILKELHKQYAYETVMDKVQASGYSLVTEEQDSKENLHIVVRRWV